jgi:DNA-binding IclR family transcriptional regulator
MAIAVRDHPAPAPRGASPGIAAVLGVLETLDRHEQCGLADLGAATGLPKTTLHRACAAMEEHGFVARIGDGSYVLGRRAVDLGTRGGCSALVSAFEAEAEALVERHNETTGLMVRDGCDVVFVSKVETTEPVRLVTRVGSRLPAFAAASGRVLLAALPPAEVDALLAGAELVTPVGRRLELRELHRILDRARIHGFAENVNETSLGLRCMAVPITARGGTVAAMTFCVPAGRIDGPRRRRLLADLKAAGRRASASLRAMTRPPDPGR